MDVDGDGRLDFVHDDALVTQDLSVARNLGIGFDSFKDWVEPNIRIDLFGLAPLPSADQRACT